MENVKFKKIPEELKTLAQRQSTSMDNDKNPSMDIKALGDTAISFSQPHVLGRNGK
jgi:hypothetical protein